MGGKDGKDVQQGGGWRTKRPHMYTQINREEQLGSETACTTQDSRQGKESPKTSGCKNLWGLWQWEKLSVSQESPLGDPRAARMHTNPPIWESAPEEHHLLVGSGGSD